MWFKFSNNHGTSVPSFSSRRIVFLLIALQFNIIFSEVFTGLRLEQKKIDKLKIAICLTGQLARLELLSKLVNIIIPNVKLGHTVHLFILLDSDVEEVKQTFWRYDYSEAPFATYDAKKMQSYINRKVFDANLGNLFASRVRLESPSQNQFEVVADFVPVEDKTIAHQNTLVGANKDGIETAADRFQNNLRWMNGLRDCVKWMQATEQEQGFFYDLVVRLRDDTLAFAPWIFEASDLKNSLTSLSLGSYRGINDHNLVVDRKYADVLFRGLTEDYYFNKTNRMVLWGNPEHRIYQVATAYKVNIRTATICKQPLIPLRASHNKTHWLLHPAYTDKLKDACVEGFEESKGCKCDRSWIELFHSGYYPIN
jgi:hypothetical protein